jgi:hypothetical protein
MVFGCDSDGNGCVGVVLKRQAKRFDQVRETFGRADDYAGLLAAAAKIGKALRTACVGKSLVQPAEHRIEIGTAQPGSARSCRHHRAPGRPGPSASSRRRCPPMIEARPGDHQALDKPAGKNHAD